MVALYKMISRNHVDFHFKFSIESKPHADFLIYKKAHHKISIRFDIPQTHYEIAPWYTKNAYRTYYPILIIRW